MVMVFERPASPRRHNVQVPNPSPDFWYGVTVTAVFAFVAYWFGVRRRRISITHRVVPMIPKGGEKLAVTWAGEEVPEPTLLQVSLESSGAGDITPANFEGGGIYLDLIKGRAIGALQTADAPPATVNDSGVIIEPFLLKKGKSVRMNFLASGENLAIDASRSSLAEASVAVWSREERRWRPVLVLAVVYALMGLAGLLAVSIPGSFLRSSTLTVVGSQATVGTFAVVLGLGMGIGVWVIFKIRRMRRQQRSSLTDVGDSQPRDDMPIK